MTTENIKAAEFPGLDHVMLFDIDDCMYVAAMSAADAIAAVKEECGDDCATSCDEVSMGMLIETANVDEGEQATPESKKTARQIVNEHLTGGGTLPFTVAFSE